MTCAFYISLILIQIGIMQSEWVNGDRNTNTFLLCIGITKRQKQRSEVAVFLGITFFTCFPILIWVFLLHGFSKGLSIVSLLILLGVLIVYQIFKKPDDVHGVVPLVLAMMWFGIIYFILTF